MPYEGTYKVQHHHRFNDGTSSDLSQSLAQHPGWLYGVQVFNLSSLSAQHIFVFDTAGAVTTASAASLIWDSPIPFSLGGTTLAQAGGFVLDMSHGITLDNGLAYAVSSANTVAAMSTVPTGLVKVNIQYVTSSCL
jgi:hypothetical protein